MKSCKLVLAVLIVALGLGYPLSAEAQESREPSILSLDDLSAFDSPGNSWQVVGSATADRKQPGEMSTTSGTGVLTYRPGGGEGEELRTEMEHGDIELELEFMLSKEARAGLFLQGRYKIQLADSWGAQTPRASDNGGVFARESSGLQPRLNASRAPGLWQRLKVSFRAPRFSDQGEKISRAVLEKVELNGVIVQSAVQLPGPAQEASFQKESLHGPLVIRAGDAPLAIRNIRYTKYEEDSQEGDLTVRRSSDQRARETPPAPVPVEPTDRPIVLRSYVDHRGTKKLFGVFVGDPEGVHYAMDLAQGALLHVWRGPFLDAGTVWRGRGMEPNSRLLDEPVPLGSATTFSGAPNTALLENETSVWPDTLGSEYRFTGYSLDASGRPSFTYTLGDIEVTDQFRPEEDGRFLRRRLAFDGSAETGTLWSRIAAGSTISRQADGSYSVGDRTFIIEMTSSGSEEPIIRRREHQAELLVPVDLSEGHTAIEYSIIW